MKIRPEGNTFIAGGLIAVLVVGLLGFPGLAAFFALLILLLLKFFSDPERITPLLEGLMVSPADGKVAEISIEEEGARLAVFMSLFDCHVNRAPLEGEVGEVSHHPGSYCPANRPESRENERNEILFHTPYGDIKVMQIAGFMARRILCWIKPGDRVKRGERMGMILFGSRVEVSFPNKGWQFLVGPGEKVKAGETIVARKVEP